MFSELQNSFKIDIQFIVKINCKDLATIYIVFVNDTFDVIVFIF
jgi:hypothetical protein